MLFDRYGRPFLKLRYILNDECNYSCIFCHFEGQARRRGVYLTAEDYGFATSVFRKVGVSDFKITGGEPLLRRDIDAVVYNIAKTGGAVTLTTNGLLLERWAAKLAAAGLQRVNVSVHSTDPGMYSKVTGAPPAALKAVLRGLREARSLGISLKINVVVLRGVNTDRDSVKELVKLAASLDASLQFIELMPTGEGAHVFEQYYEPVETVAKAVAELGGRPLKLRKELHNRPIYVLAGVAIELIKNYGNASFCSGCTTMRLTSDGKLKTCIYAEPSVDLMPLIKARDEEGLLYAVKTALAQREPRFKLYLARPAEPGVPSGGVHSSS
ncbi:GTP 3',8-cyclase MoaA [Pyrobaculum neutrophilum]|uniref:Probable GTP 3',8-cyclase n=1 Tax=Pyrobaculum neutrophilum (strain DSM 2338 / JCM 9278 / NBRC 100436 / V24Sta) TaxID=444157 RepID=B1YA39_PYRNV|nr:GTP 3',8-cyclase MoaA [Pyrobaculum neutrophilum]ACB39013.1 molybdenum cofactor biosynthesis protein A [Pyrobaculum neutrophilum V24Sta]